MVILTMVILILNKINLDNFNFYEDHSETIFISDFWLGPIDLNNVKHLKKDINKDLMPVAWHPTRWWDWFLAEDEKKGKQPIFNYKSSYKVGKWLIIIGQGKVVRNSRKLGQGNEK